MCVIITDTTALEKASEEQRETELIKTKVEEFIKGE